MLLHIITVPQSLNVPTSTIFNVKILVVSILSFVKLLFTKLLPSPLKSLQHPSAFHKPTAVFNKGLLRSVVKPTPLEKYCVIKSYA